MNGKNNKNLLKQWIAMLLIAALISCLTGEFQANAEEAVPNIKNQTFCAGAYFSAFIKADNSLWTAGGSGIIGNGMIMSDTWMQGDWLADSKGVPIKIMDDAKSVYTNGNMTCYAIKTDNSLWALGVNDGAFGDGTLQPSKIPVKIMDNVAFVSSKKYSYLPDGPRIEGQGLTTSRGYTVIALKTDGTLWSWGTNRYGEVGDGTREPRLFPVKVMDNVVYAAHGSTNVSMTDDVFSSYAIKSDGSLWSWGSNKSGQLGDGTLEDRAMPVKIMDNVKTIEAAGGSCTAVKKDGSYWSWGLEFTHTIDRTIYYSMSISPKKIADGVIYATAGSVERYFIKNDGSLWAWGTAPRLDLIGSGQSFSSAVPIKIMDNVRYLHNGQSTNFAIKTDNSLWGWGSNDGGQVGIGFKSNDYVANPAVVMDHVFAVSTSLWSTYFLRTDGTLWGVGNDNYCQFGQGSGEYIRTTPVLIAENVKFP